jgi:histone H3/H4
MAPASTETSAAGTPTTTTAAAPTKTASVPTGGNSSSTAIEFEPPLACVRRILKHALPSSTNVGKDASAAFARACGIFVIYITACANDFARENKRQTITANDVLAAVKVRVMLD